MSGLAYKKDALAIKADKMVRVLRGGNIGEEQFYFKGDDVFISSELVKPELYLRKNYMITPAVSSLDHIGKIALTDKDYSDTVVGGFVLMLIPHFNNDVVSQYLLYAFAAKHHRDNCRNITHKSGQAFYNLSREQMMNLPVPIPPREEMKRIIAMLKRVLPKVADYAVVDTALQNLNGSFPEALKKSILQEAVQGKLVPQDPSDEPAEALLERIRMEKQRLIKEGKIKKDKHESVIFRRDNSHYEKCGSDEVCIDDEIPFEIPDSWMWARLKSLGYTQTGNTPSTSHPEYRGGYIPFITPGDIVDGIIDYGNQGLSEMGKDVARVCPAGSILQVCIGGSIGKAALSVYEVAFNQQINAISPVVVSSKYVLAAVTSFMFLSAMKESAGGTATPILNRTLWDKMLIPLPPLNEQNRIVSTIEQLFPVVATL
mgnify:CR=1 FL=1